MSKKVKFKVKKGKAKIKLKSGDGSFPLGAGELGALLGAALASATGHWLPAQPTIRGLPEGSIDVGPRRAVDEANSGGTGHD